MGKFNESTKGSMKTTNLAGGSAYKINDLRLKVTMGVLTTFVNEPKYYGDNTTELQKDIRELVSIDAKFVANLAIYTRKVMHMRSITHMLVCELANNPKGKVFVREVVGQVAERVDDMTEIMAYQLNVYGKPIPNSLKKGIADAILTFDEYQLAKYNRDGAVKLKDLVLLTHPNPKTAEQSLLMKKILDDVLETPITWETQLSAQDGRTKKEKWESLILNKQLGYMATLRNLRNILDAGVSSMALDTTLSYLSNEKAVANSKQLPFRYFSAYRELEENPMAGSKVLDTLETAISLSVANLPRLSGTTFFTADESGSMESQLSDRSKVTYKDVANLLMAIGHKFCDNAITSCFGESFAVKNVSTKNGILANKRMFDKVNVGYSTYLYKSIQWLIDNKVVVDRIVVFSDMQCYGNGWGTGNAQKLIEQYKMSVNPNVIVHSIDLAGHGTTQFIPSSKVNLIAGWSDKVLQYMSLCESGEGTLVNNISKHYFN